MQPADNSFEAYAASQLQQQCEEIARQWVERIASERQVRPRRVLPEDELLGVMPGLLGHVADFLLTEREGTLLRRSEVIEPLHALTTLRQSQGCDPQELICELDLLAQVLDGACLEWIRTFPGTPPPASVVRIAGRLNRAPILMAEICVGAFWEQETRERCAETERVHVFVDALAHELKTPLGAAEGAALLLENDEVVGTSQEPRRFAGLIQRNLRRARTTIDNVRELATVGPSRSAPGHLLPLALVLGNVLAEVREVIAAAGVELHVEEPVPATSVDAARLEIVLLNLIGNAAKYSDPARANRWVDVRFGSGHDGGRWYMEVSDNGLGIPADHRTRVFERSFRSHPEHAEGTGLGLAIVHDAVRQLGGHIDVESEPGAGSVFRVWLPLTPTEETS
jgi:signal transduction histidine kinase